MPVEQILHAESDKLKGLTAEQLREWTQLNPIPLNDVIKPFTAAEFDKVGYVPTLLRRSAEATRAANRKTPVSQVRNV